MAEKTDEEIMKEVGLESKELTPEEALEELSLDDDNSLEPVSKEDADELKVEDVRLTEESNTNETNENVIANEDKDDEKSDESSQEKNEADLEEEIPVQKKQPKILKILIAVAVFLGLIIVIGAVLYFIGFFDPEPVEKPKEVKQMVKEVKPEVDVDIKDLDKNRLNKKLTMLTKHEIMNKKELEAEEERIKEEERKKKEAQEKALEEKKKKQEEALAAQYAKIEEEKKILQEQQAAIKKEQEEFLKMQDQLKMQLEETKAQLLNELKMQEQMKEDEEVIEEPSEGNMPKEDESMMEEETKEESSLSNSFLSFINVATIKGELYKSFLDDVMKYDKNIALCRDSKNRIEIYFGPYDSQKERQKVLNSLLENGYKESYLVDFTNEEYIKRCKY